MDYPIYKWTAQSMVVYRLPYTMDWSVDHSILWSGLWITPNNGLVYGSPYIIDYPMDYVWLVACPSFCNPEKACCLLRLMFRQPVWSDLQTLKMMESGLKYFIHTPISFLASLAKISE